MNASIGGYFGLELNDYGSIFHDDLVALNCGRNAFEYILIQKRYKKVYIPYYTCDVIIQPLLRQKVEYEFYFLDDVFLPINVEVRRKEALLYVNYFGLMNQQVNYLVGKYSGIIIDNSQAFYQKPLKDIDTFYSPRKFFGLPDGGFASCKKETDFKLDIDCSLNRLSHLFTRIDKGTESGYMEFQTNDKKLDNIPLMKMSRLTEKLMRNINFEAIKKSRNDNFYLVHSLLFKENELSVLIEKSVFEAPMVYPFLRKDNNTLRKKLIENKIYTATYWPNVEKWLAGANCWERYLQNNLIALPIDQRYTQIELQIATNFIVNEL